MFNEKKGLVAALLFLLNTCTMKKMLKKSEVLREGYVNGLKEAKRIIEEQFIREEPHYEARVRNIKKLMDEERFERMVRTLRCDFSQLRNVYKNEGVEAFFDSDVMTILDGVDGDMESLKNTVGALKKYIRGEGWYVD